MTGIGLSDGACPYGQIAPTGYAPSITVITNTAGRYPAAALPGFVCGIYSLQATIPNQPSAGPDQSILVEISTPPTATAFAAYSQSQTLTFAVVPQ